MANRALKKLSLRISWSQITWAESVAAWVVAGFVFSTESEVCYFETIHKLHVGIDTCA